MREQFHQYIRDLQEEITTSLENLEGEGHRFHEDLWDREGGGGGRTRVLENGNIIEKGGVNISAVYGPLSPSMQRYFEVGDVDFFAAGLSLVIHPENPMAPTVHANWRYFEMYDKTGATVDCWFGGGLDLTPYYLFDEDAEHFHRTCKKACDKHDAQFYPHYKKRCDEYFWNSHRDEARGIGGLFFDYLKPTDSMSVKDWYAFVTETADHFLEAYLPILKKRHSLDYSSENREWQEIRRGRYAEFNLVHDRGTLFGLKTNGRIESILISLPPEVRWKYNHLPKENTEEARLVEVLKEPKSWV